MDAPFWMTSDSVAATEAVVEIIATKYAASSYDDVIAGIELLNEPLMSELVGGQAGTQNYYQNASNIVRSVSQTVPVIIQDGFVNPSQWNGFLTGSNALVDHHEYQVFTNAYVALTPEEHVSTVCSNADSWAEGQDKYLIAGEWTAAMTDWFAALSSLTAI